MDSHQGPNNPFMVNTAEKQLTILLISLQQKPHSENIWRRNVDKNLAYNSPSNIFYIHAFFSDIFKNIITPDDNIK